MPKEEIAPLGVPQDTELGGKEDSELEDILDEEALEELAKEIDEESEIIEEDIPTEFIPTNSRTSPVLERVAGEQEVGWVRREGTVREEEESKGVKYTATNEPQYGASKPNSDNRDTWAPQLDRFSETTNQFTGNRDLFVNELNDMQKSDRKIYDENTSNVKTFESEKRNKLPFENQEDKYN